MNIAYFLIPKSSVAYLYDDFTFRQGLEKMRHHGYTAIPVITRDGQYVGTVSEGDFLWQLLSEEQSSQHPCSMRDLSGCGSGTFFGRTAIPLSGSPSAWRSFSTAP